MDEEDERPYKRIKLSMEVDEPSDWYPHPVYLPDLVVERVFSFLNLRELAQVSRVCKQWYFLSRRSVFWRRVDTQCLALDSGRTEGLLRTLPASVTRLRLDGSRAQCLSLTQVSVLLRSRCPGLRVLWLNRARMSYGSEQTGSIAFVLELLPSDLRVLALRHSSFARLQNMKRDKTCSSRIEVLDVARSYGLGRDALTMASMMPRLRRLCLAGCSVVDTHFQPYYPVIANLWELDLEGTLVGSRTYHAVWQYGHNLRELYLCHTVLQDGDLPHKKRLPHLRVLCLRNTELSRNGVQCIAESCPSLSRLIVSIPYVRPPWTRHFEVETVIGAKYCDHFEVFDYMRES